MMNWMQTVRRGGPERYDAMGADWWRFVFKMMNFVWKMMNSVLNLMILIQTARWLWKPGVWGAAISEPMEADSLAVSAVTERQECAQWTLVWAAPGSSGSQFVYNRGRRVGTRIPGVSQNQQFSIQNEECSIKTRGILYWKWWILQVERRGRCWSSRRAAGRKYRWTVWCCRVLRRACLHKNADFLIKNANKMVTS